MQKKPILLIMAAGMGSRYGGVKQLEHVGPSGEIIMDYSIYAAKEAGFEDVVIIIKEDMEEDFEEIIGKRLRPYINLQYAYQKLDDLPAGYKIPKGRVKPWGTGHAVLAARDIIDTAFCVINADDYYGLEAFSLMFDCLNSEEFSSEKDIHSLCTWKLNNTLSPYGTVSRGVCELDSSGNLLGIKELKKIAPDGEDAKYTLDEGKTWHNLSGSTSVSMNFFGFKDKFMQVLLNNFTKFLDHAIENDDLKAEYLLPEILGNELKKDNVKIKTMESTERWFGVTYKEDKPIVEKSLQELVAAGHYPTPLWK